jgi:hypothetical protein
MNNQSYGELAHWGLVDDDPTCARCGGEGELLAECFEASRIRVAVLTPRKNTATSPVQIGLGRPPLTPIRKVQAYNL